MTRHEDPEVARFLEALEVFVIEQAVPIATALYETQDGRRYKCESVNGDEMTTTATLFEL